MLVMEFAGFLDRQARNAEAVAAYHDALKLDERLLRPQLELCRLYSPSRLNEPANARTHGEAAVNGYRALGASGGEGQSLLCLADVLVVGKDEERNQASSHARAAYKIFEDLRYDYSQVRAEYYLALVAAMQGRFAESLALGEKALIRARTAGNIAIQGTLMSNLGAAHVSLGNRAEGADYYQQAYKLFQSWRDEVRAARIQANRGALLIESGKPAEGILDIKNALSVSERLGDRNFQTYCLRVIATYYRNQGRHGDAIRELNKALAIARERNLGDNITVMTTFVALSQFETGDYDGARRSLLSALADGTGRQSTEARIRLARTFVRLGDVDKADTELRQAERDLQQSPNEALRSLQLLVRGELALELQQVEEAHTSFERASVTPAQTLPAPSAIEARSYLGLVTARGGNIDGGRRLIRAALAAGEELGHHGLVAKSRIQLLEIELLARRSGEAASILSSVPSDDDTATIGPELRAEAHHLRGQLEAARGETEAAGASTDAARRIIQDLALSLPEEYRRSFADRPTLRHLR